MNSKLTRYCDGLIEAGWLAAVVVTPLFFNIHSSRVFEPDKLTLLRSIATLMAVAWIIKFIDLQGWRDLSWLGWKSERSIWRMPFVLPVFLLAVVYLLSTVFSVTRSVSWAGSYQRLQGTYTTLSYIIVFTLMLATLRRREQINRLVTTIIITSIPISLYAMLQHFGLDPLPWGGDTQARVAGHMGNSIFIAAYLIMVVPLTLARIIDAFTNILHDDELAVADVIRSSIYIFALAIQLITIYWTNSRGPFLGLAVSMFAFILVLLVTLRNAEPSKQRFSLSDFGKALLVVLLGTVLPLLIAVLILSASLSEFATFAFFIGSVGALVVVILILALAQRGWRWLWASWILVAITMAAFLGLFNLTGDSTETLAETPIVGDTLNIFSDWRSLPQIGRFGSLLQSEQGSGRVRVLIWEGVLELINLHEPLEAPDGGADPFNFLRPVFGYGPESMYVAYNRFYQPELATIEARNASPDRSHNETFDAIVITGTAGLLVWQLLYLSVFYYGFKWLGVVKSKRDRNVLIGLWIGGAIVGGAIITSILGLPFLGVAIPFGAIIGLILYLIYYAVFTSAESDEEDSDPFSVDRLLMIAIVAAVLAHYVEIHFGIAIASTRTHFFVYIALMFLLGYLLPKIKAVEEVEFVETVPKRRRRKSRVVTKRNEGWAGPVWSGALVLGLMIGVLSYDFLTYSVPDGNTIQSAAEVPGAGEIINQSFFVNASNNFVDSPFIYLLIILTWSLGGLLFLSEMAKRGLIGSNLPLGKPVEGRVRTAGFIFVALLVGGLAYRFFFRSLAASGPSSLLADASLFVYSALALWAAFRLLVRNESARTTAAWIAVIGIAYSLAILPAGAILPAVIVFSANAAVLYLLWDRSWSDSLTPALIVVLVSMTSGLAYALFHASQIRAGILPPPEATEVTSDLVRRVLEANQTINLLTWFYVFLIGMLFLIALVVAWPKATSIRSWASTPGLVAFVVLIPLAFYSIANMNLQIIQADIAYKRADPWDKQAARAGDPALWDNAIAIYEHAIELAPAEDFYYLWLGRAYLERSGVTEDESEQERLLDTAEARLIDAQSINPLNTDHTANLARLNTRWAELTEGEERRERVEIASDYYEAAMSLSPQNAVIINEYARLAYLLEENCEKAAELYDRSVRQDPYFQQTYIERAEVLKVCGDQAEGPDQLDYYQRAAESMQEALNRRPNDARRWLQLAELNLLVGDESEALDAYERAKELADENTPVWQMDYTMAQWFLREELYEQAQEFAERAEQQAPADVQGQISQFVEQIINRSSPDTGLPTVPETSANRPLAQIEPADRHNFYASPPEMILDDSKDYEAIIHTEKGPITLRLFKDEAPLTVNNFVFLAREGFYDGLSFQRVIQDFMAQGGDPLGTGGGGPGYTFADELDNGLTFDRPGLLAMANRGPATNGSQFFITFVPTPHLNGLHTIFGEVIEGEEVLNSLTFVQPGDGQVGDAILQIDIVER